MRGKYIVIEGHDGTGKSTQVTRLKERIEATGRQVETVEEPAGVPIADELRTIIKNGELERDPTTNLLLFTAARRAIYEQKVEPSLGDGAIVLAARNWISTVAYQGYGEGLDPNEIEKITRQFTGTRYMAPDLTVVLDVADSSIREERIAARGELEKPDAFESREDAFKTKVSEGYLKVAEEYGFPILDASGTLDEVEALIWERVEPLVN
jgi:dTMP kinase